MLRSILHCDMNNFYASVECMLDPALKKYPIAVCGSVEERHGIVLAKNYKAKAFDVKTGDAVWQAKQKCKDLVVVPPHYEEYIKYSKLARSVYERYTDQVEPYGMDECWLDISGTESLFGSPEKVANEIRETMKFELGLTISVGVSFNKIFAKLGSDMKKPDAVTVIPKDTFKEKIWGLPAADLLGVGRATQRVLDSYCIRTIGDLANNDPEFLRRRLGKNGVVLWNYANGNDLSLVAKKDFVSPIKSVGHGITTVADLEKPEQVWPVFLELTQDIGHKLRVHGLSAEGVAIHIRDNTLNNKDIIRVFPRTLSNTNTSLVLKTPKTKTSVRKIFLPSTVAQMLLERKKQIDEMKELFGDEYLDYDLVFCHSSGRPMEGQVINRALKKLIQDNDLPDVVFHSFRHASITYKLKWNGGDMKSVQGDSGHARMDMVADVYSHIIDEDRRYNAQKFEEQFYNAKGLKNAEEGKTAPMPKFETSVELLDPMAEVQKESEVEKEKPAENSTDENAALLTKLLSNPETAALLKALAKTI